MVHAVAAVLARASQQDCAVGLLVLFGVTCRPRDIGEMTGAKYDLNTKIVWVRSKAWRVNRRRHGEWEPHPVRSEEAQLILEDRKASHGEGLLFPLWSGEHVQRAVQAAAETHGWPRDLRWDGAHTARHGSAAEIFASALQAVQEGGGWATVRCAKKYARSNVQRRW